MEINSLYSTTLTTNSKLYRKDEDKIGITSPIASDTLSISIQARELAANAQDSDGALSSDLMNKYKYGDVNTYDNMSFIEKAKQAILDKRVGLDREKVEEINQKMEDIMNDKTIPAEEKAEMLEQLDEEKQKIFEDAAKRTGEDAKNDDKQTDE